LLLGEARLGRAELELGHVGRALLGRIPVEDRAFLTAEVEAEVPLRAAPMDGFAGLRHGDLAGMRILYRDLALQHVVEAMLVEEGLPRVRRAEIAAGLQLEDQGPDHLVAAIDQVGDLARLAVAPKEAGGVAMAHHGRTLEGRGAPGR